jgi:hypothetical protein
VEEARLSGEQGESKELAVPFRATHTSPGAQFCSKRVCEDLDYVQPASLLSPRPWMVSLSQLLYLWGLLLGHVCEELTLALGHVPVL